MELHIILIFLSSGLFLGWSLGANDAANVFGTAVGSRMVRFGTAAILASIFVILGAVISGSGAAHGLSKLGSVNAIAGSFTCALSAGLTVYWMTRAGLPVSTTQAIVGAIIGWNLYSGSITDERVVGKIAATWVACPIIGAIVAAILFAVIRWFLSATKMHLLRIDSYTRTGLILAGVFGSYSLGANNIANVMGVFVDSSPFQDSDVGGLFEFTSTHKLFLLGGLAIAAGIFTYSKRVMTTVGNTLFPLTPLGAFVVVVSHSVVLFLFSSTSLEHFLASRGLPTIPLIPVSSSQAVVGAIIGIGLVKGAAGARLIRWRALFSIASGWVSTPIISALVCLFLVFFIANVFNREVYREVRFVLTRPVLDHLGERGVHTEGLASLEDRSISSATSFLRSLREHVDLPRDEEELVIRSAEIFETRLDLSRIAGLDAGYLSPTQLAALRRLAGREFRHRWQLEEALATANAAWKKKPGTCLNKPYNKGIDERLNYVARRMRIQPEEGPTSLPVHGLQEPPGARSVGQ